jgi:polyferredoxin
VASIRASGAASLDLLRVPLVGRFLSWRHARTTAQVVLLLLAALVVYDGFFGPQLAPMNMAGVLPWLHFRGLVVLALLAAGNLFCMACPFMLTRRLGKRLLPGGRAWPHRLQGKWLAVGVLVVFFFSYEAFDLWASPLLTASLVLAFFTGAFVLDGLFKGAVFCKHVCPIGQFNFVNSLSSPFEMKVRSREVCASCATKDCIRGRYERPGLQASTVASADKDALAVPVSRRGTGRERGRLLQSGCELWLFQEQKRGNMDCTFCLDCVQACPHDNVGMTARVPARELWENGPRAGLGRMLGRQDVAALVLVLVFAAFVNAFGMVGPFYSFAAWLAGALNTNSEFVVLGIVFAAGLVLLPSLVAGAAAWASRALSGSRDSIRAIATRYSFSLAPLGFGMWLAHYLFHFLTGALTIVPVTQSFLEDFGISLLGSPQWGLASMVPASWVIPIELILLEGGLLLSLVAGYRIAGERHEETQAARREFLPWATLMLLLFAVGVWLLLQPMEMRGTLSGG